MRSINHRSGWFRRHPRRPLRRSRLKQWIFFVVSVATITVVIGGGAALAVILRSLPVPEELFAQRVVQSTKIYDRSGAVLLFEFHGEIKRTVIPFAEIPSPVKNAAIAIEDVNFYRHGGIDLRGILRALVVNIIHRDLRQGGSTITQQLVKNSFLGHERTLRRKIKEAVLAISLEAKLDKDEILNLYLNQIPYGANAYGVEAASQTFFGKHARDLNVGEAALLATLPRAPTYYSPYGPHKDELLARKNLIVGRMEELGYLTPEEAERAQGEPLKFLPATKNIRAPHFVMFVRDYLANRYGEEAVAEGGLTVTTTLDWGLHEEAERLVARGAERNEKLIQAQNMALVAINPKNGEILSMVGSRDYFDTEHDGNFNVATALRQPGSAFKPFVYATAFKKGFQPETVLFDIPTEFNPQCTPEGTPRPESRVRPEDCYHPQDYDETFRGPVSLRQAVAQSLNIPSVKLLYLAGVEDSIRTAEDLGISSLGDRARFGLSLVLGGAEVKLLEMTGAFGAFAYDGVWNSPAAILKVADASGKIVEEKQDHPRPVLDPHIARVVNDVLSDNQARIPVFQPHSSLYFPDRTVAVKTGTTQDYRDAWTVGYTPSLVVGVWAGNNDNTPMQQKGSGVMAAAPTWHDFLDFALKAFPPEEFIKPEQVRTTKPVLAGVWQGDSVVTIDTLSQKRATELTPPESRQEVAFGEPHDPLYWIDRDDPLGPPLADPRRDPQFPNWETAFQEWRKRTGFTPRSLTDIPADFDDVHVPSKQPRVVAGAKIDLGGNVIIRVSVEATYGLKEIAVVASGKIIATRSNPPSPVEFIISRHIISPESPSVSVRVYDRVGNIATVLLDVPER